MTPFPLIPLDLLERLEAAFPNRLPESVSISHQEVAALIGEQRVLGYLRCQYEHQSGRAPGDKIR